LARGEGRVDVMVDGCDLVGPRRRAGRCDD
jgi:hypothetical protein